jgi:hypothetical protein
MTPQPIQSMQHTTESLEQQANRHFQADQEGKKKDVGVGPTGKLAETGLWRLIGLEAPAAAAGPRRRRGFGLEF